MISLEKAKKLKEAGLTWEPQEGDLVCHSEAEDYFYITTDDMEDYVQATRIDKEYAYSIAIFLPRLDQLLAEIEKRGYSWEMRTVIDESQSVRFNAKNIAYWIHVWKTGHIEWEDGFKRAFTSPSNAAASALLWIYEGRAKA